MKNKNRPFFYEKKETPLWKWLLIFLCIAAVLIIIGLQIPTVRQRIVEPIYAAASFLVNSARDLFNMTRMYHEKKSEKNVYEPLEFPDSQVLFAESLENLSAISQEDPLADLRQTPTPSEYSKVAAWEYLDPNLNYAISSGGLPKEETVSIQLIPPVFEHADLFNDGPAILSADLRYWGITENQYHIAQMIHPNQFDPFTSFSDIQNYISQSYENLLSITRLNGTTDDMVGLLQCGIPVILLIQFHQPYAFWLQDDHIGCQYVLLLGYDSQKSEFSFQDTIRGNTMKISESELLSAWYPYQREYLVIYPAEKDEDVKEALKENYFEELNTQRALAKFKNDSEMLPENPYAQYNYAAMLHKDNDNGGAWDSFQKAQELSLPQRYFNSQTDMLQTALELGFADDLTDFVKPLWDRNNNDEILTLYLGWAEILRNNYKEGISFFEKAEKINPHSESVRYALRYKDTMLN